MERNTVTLAESTVEIFRSVGEFWCWAVWFGKSETVQTLTERRGGKRRRREEAMSVTHGART